jgi:3-hydroxy-9,10-secoandrosta-1,3,5(10)-triene-9,17-dione monooxygenase
MSAVELGAPPKRGHVAFPQPEPGLTPQTVIARAAALRPLLREQQAENDERGFFSDELHQAFIEGGHYRILQPKLFGGYEFDYPTFIRVIHELAQGHPSTAWCYTLASSHVFLLSSHWPEEAQREIFEACGGDIRVCQRASPAGTIERVDGGYVVDGTFGYASGAPRATHFAGSTMFKEGEGPPKALTFIVPKAKYEVVPDWGGDANLAMQGSGSNSIRLDKVFLPEHHVVDVEMMMSSQGYNDGTPGTRLHGNPMYIGVAAGAFLTEFGAITAGTARAALEEYERLLDVTPIPRGGGTTRRQDPEAWRVMGRAMNMTDSAWAITLAAVNEYMEQVARWAEDRTPITMGDTLKLWGMSQEACKLACGAVDMLFETAGPRASLRGQRMQRYFRDIQAYRVHTTAQPSFATLRAQARLGVVPPGRPGA